MIYQSNNKVFTSMFLILIYIFAFSLVLPVENARILAVEPAAGKSHWNVVSSVIRVLTDNGHHVTVFTSFTDGNRENYTEVDISKKVLAHKMDMDLMETMKKWAHPISLINFVKNAGLSICNMLYESAELNKIMQKHENSHFDIVLVEFLGVNCLSYLATKLNLPIIYIITSPIITYAERSVSGHFPNPATTSHILFNYAVPKTFIQRLSNTVLLTYSMCILSYGKWIDKYINPKPYNLITRHVPPSLIFLNSHFISEASRQYPPNVIQVGGIHLKPANSLPNASIIIL